MTNARSARTWLLEKLGVNEAAVSKHFVAVSTNAKEVAAFGIDTENMFEFWDWVGGRYSMDSAIGLSTMIAVGPERFRRLLSGFHAMDEHFRLAPLERNMPVLLGLISIWNTNFLGAETVAILPYDQYLTPVSCISAAAHHGEQRKERDAARVARRLCDGADLLGRAGHQRPALVLSADSPRTRLIPCDFIAFREPLNPLGDHHDLLMANMLAQSEALAFGKTRGRGRRGGHPGAAHRSTASSKGIVRPIRSWRRS